MILKLVEYRTKRLARSQFSREDGRLLDALCGDKIDVREPGFRTNDEWWLTPSGWVGFIPLRPGLGIKIEPKTPLANLFRMLEYAYSLESFELLKGLFDAGALEEFYDRLAAMLARMVLVRGRKGFHRSYEPESERLGYLRGRMDVGRVMRAPWDTQTLCHYEEHTADTVDNRILAWTMYVIARSRLCTDRTIPEVRKAYRELASLTTLGPVAARACVGRHYHRLNEDYRPMHALCRFFLENSGPSHEIGDRTMLPFLVNMARLFEQFVAEWLRKHLPEGFGLKSQESVPIGMDTDISFALDLVIYDTGTNRTRYVLDTKYKDPNRPDPSDISQVVSYAAALHCDEAVLIYPGEPTVALEQQVGRIRVRRVAFDVGRDLAEAGSALLARLGIVATTATEHSQLSC
jgi:5-methylcytosine-specific restriction enzyme subunit McrC